MYKRSFRKAGILMLVLATLLVRDQSIPAIAERVDAPHSNFLTQPDVREDSSTNSIELISIRKDGTQGNSSSGLESSTIWGERYSASISPDGYYVAYTSGATNLVEGDDNYYPDIFVTNRKTGDVKRVSVALNWNQGEDPNGPSRWPTISKEGKYIAFLSQATNLVANDTNGIEDVFVYDVENSTTYRVSVSSSGQEQNHAAVDPFISRPSISADGRYVAFHSMATNLVDFGGEGNFYNGVYVHDLFTGQTQLVSISLDGEPTDGGFPAISGDGKFVAFITQSAGQGIASGVLVRNLETGEVRYVSYPPGGGPIEIHCGGNCYFPAISETGAFIVYQELSIPYGNFSIFLRDMDQPYSVRIEEGYGDQLSVSSEGRFVAYTTLSGVTLSNTKTATSTGVTLYDMETATSTVVSQLDENIPANGSSFSPSMSADGRYIVFVSKASNLVDNDSNGNVADIFVYDRIGEYSVSGTVIDEITRQPVPGVVVSAGANATGITDENGFYTIPNVKAGTVTITPSQIGGAFTPENSTIRVNSDASGVDFIKRHIIDVTVSLYRTPTGEEKVAYESIVGYFADAVYEMSNGAHHLRNVTFYVNGENSDRANIIWQERAWPNGFPGGYGHDGMHIYFADIFESGNFNYLESNHWKEAGYTLGHEWGHYYYGLYDEWKARTSTGKDLNYWPRIDDVRVVPSIMNAQWNAVSGDYRWLNFSTDGNPTFQRGKNAQFRVYGSPGWVTLTTPPSNDPPRGEAEVFPVRPHYPELIAVAPGYQQYPSIELDKVLQEVSRMGLHVEWSGTTTHSRPSTSTSDTSFTAVIASLNGNSISYPQLVQLYASVANIDPIAKAGLTVFVTDPDMTTSSLLMRDDGIAPDAIADDGFYSGIMNYSQDGSYTISANFNNDSMLAFYTEDVAAHSIGPNEETYVPTYEPVGENFNASDTTVIQITGYRSDDHGDSRSNATFLQADNEHRPGRIDRPADLDVFRIIPNSSGNLAIRVTDLASDMQPALRIYDEESNLIWGDYQQVSNGYLLMLIHVKAGETIYAEVSHLNSAAATGWYSISAGDRIISELPLDVFLPMLFR